MKQLLSKIWNFIVLALLVLHVLPARTLSERALVFAFWKHLLVGQFYGWRPYFYHLHLVAGFARRFMPAGLTEAQRQLILAACYLHDIIEDARLTYNDVKERFGVEVAEIVYALSNEKGRNRAARANAAYYQGIVVTPYATFVKLCDRAANTYFSKRHGTSQIFMYKKEQRKFILALSPLPADCLRIAAYIEAELSSQVAQAA